MKSFLSDSFLVSVLRQFPAAAAMLLALIGVAGCKSGPDLTGTENRSGARKTAPVPPAPVYNHGHHLAHQDRLIPLGWTNTGDAVLLWDAFRLDRPGGLMAPPVSEEWRRIIIANFRKGLVRVGRTASLIQNLSNRCSGPDRLSGVQNVIRISASPGISKNRLLQCEKRLPRSEK